MNSDLPLYSSELSVCIAILAKAYEENSLSPSYTALQHVFLKQEKFSPILEELVKKIQKGRIEIFISGGQESSRNKWQALHALFKNTQLTNQHVSITVVEDLFGNFDLGKCYLCTGEMIYPGECGLKYVGFDTEGNPFQIINIANSQSNAVLAEKVVWLKV